MWGTSRKSKTSTRESHAKAPRKECAKVKQRKQSSAKGVYQGQAAKAAAKADD